MDTPQDRIRSMSLAFRSFRSLLQLFCLACAVGLICVMFVGGCLAESVLSSHNRVVGSIYICPMPLEGTIAFPLRGLYF